MQSWKFPKNLFEIAHTKKKLFQNVLESAKEKWEIFCDIFFVLNIRSCTFLCTDERLSRKSLHIKIFMCKNRFNSKKRFSKMKKNKSNRTKRLQHKIKLFRRFRSKCCQTTSNNF